LRCCEGLLPAAAVALVLSIWAPASEAQAPPPAPPNPGINPGAVGTEGSRTLQQLEQQYPPPTLQGPPVVGTPPAVSEAPLAPGVHFVLKAVTFDASKFLTPAELDALAAPDIGKDVDLAELQKIVDAVNALYGKKGVVTARAVLPPQTVRDGTVHIALVEGKLGQVTVKGNEYVADHYVTDRIPLPPDQTIDVPGLARNVNYFNLTNDAQLRALLQPGASFGLTDVQLAVQEPKRNTVDLFADNEGVDTTGEKEAGGLFRRYGLFDSLDLLTLYGTYSKGELDGSGSYSIPIDLYGGRIGVSYTRDHIHIIYGPFTSLAISGESQTAAINASHPLYAADAFLVAANLSASDTISKTDEVGSLVSDDTTYKWSSGLTFSRTTADSSMSISPLFVLANSRDQVLDTTRDFRFFNGTANATTVIVAPYSLVFSGAWQWTSQKLLPADQLFEIGGPTTVRGYASNALGGSSGYYADLELHRSLAGVLAGLDGFAFLDQGQVFNPVPSHRGLVAPGLGLDWTYESRITAELTAAFPVARTVPQHDSYRLLGRLVVHIM
jgi:hemolysin activation/secretion protein